MRERTPRYLMIAGSGALVIGVTVTVILVARRSHCSANPYDDNSGCLSYNPSIHWAFALIVFGAVLIVAAALAAVVAIAAVIVRRWITREGFADAALRINIRAWRYYLVALLLPLAVVLVICALASALSIGRPDFSIQHALLGLSAGRAPGPSRRPPGPRP